MTNWLVSTSGKPFVRNGRALSATSGCKSECCLATDCDGLDTSAIVAFQCDTSTISVMRVTFGNPCVSFSHTPSGILVWNSSGTQWRHAANLTDLPTCQCGTGDTLQPTSVGTQVVIECRMTDGNGDLPSAPSLTGLLPNTPYWRAYYVVFQPGGSQTLTALGVRVRLVGEDAPPLGEWALNHVAWSEDVFGFSCDCGTGVPCANGTPSPPETLSVI